MGGGSHCETLDLLTVWWLTRVVASFVVVCWVAALLGRLPVCRWFLLCAFCNRSLCLWSLGKVRSFRDSFRAFNKDVFFYVRREMYFLRVACGRFLLW